MSEEEWEGRLEGLFSGSVPKRDPSPSAQSAAVRPGETRTSSEAPSLEGVTVSPDHGATHPDLLNLILAASLGGEAVAVIALVVVLYRNTPREIRGAQTFFAAAAFVVMSLFLLFVQWQLAKRLFSVERLVRRRNVQLNKAVTVVQGYQKELGRATQAVRDEQARLDLCAQVGRLAAGGLPPEEFARQAAEQIQGRFEPCFVSVFALDRDGKGAALLSTAGSASRAALARLEGVAVADSVLLRECVNRGGPYIVEDLAASSQAGESLARDPLLVAQTGSVISVPVTAGGRAVGGITVHCQASSSLGEKDASLLMLVADLAAPSLAGAYPGGSP